MNWKKIYSKYPLACYEMYKWVFGDERSISYDMFSETEFYNSITNKGYVTNEEKTLEFFDDKFIWCYVQPVGLLKFKSHAESESKTIVCIDHPTRHKSLVHTLENAFSLLNDRISSENNGSH